MKLLRYGEIGNEKPGVLDKDGNIRDLSGHIDDVSGAVLNESSLNKLREINFEDLPRTLDIAAGVMVLILMFRANF